MTSLSKPVLGENPVLSRHYSITRGCPLNTGFTLLVSQNVFYYILVSHLRLFFLFGSDKDRNQCQLRITMNKDRNGKKNSVKLGK